jgi:hypothetical protein
LQGRLGAAGHLDETGLQRAWETRAYKTQYRATEIAPTQAISTRANPRAKKAPRPFSRGCTLIMLSVKFYLPLGLEEEGWEVTSPLRERPPSVSLQ